MKLRNPMKVKYRENPFVGPFLILWFLSVVFGLMVITLVMISYPKLLLGVTLGILSWVFINYLLANKRMDAIERLRNL
jgi:hypothetical protein